jgi:hypothetical protein
MKSSFVSKMMIFCLILIAGFMLGPSDGSAALPAPCADLQCDCQDVSTCGDYNATCTFIITNCGDVDLCEVILDITGQGPALNNSNGCDGSGLPVGESRTITLTFPIPPGIYSPSVIAYDAYGGVTEDSCDTFSIAMCVPADIKPMSCPNPLSLMNKGVLPVAILGTPDFDVTMIDPETIELEGVAPLRWSVEDVTAPYIGDANEDCMSCAENGEDGYPDLTLKFDAQEVIAALGDVVDGQCLVVKLTGNLKEEFGGIPISAQDVLLIIGNQ